MKITSSLHGLNLNDCSNRKRFHRRSFSLVRTWNTYSYYTCCMLLCNIRQFLLSASYKSCLGKFLLRSLTCTSWTKRHFQVLPIRKSIPNELFSDTMNSKLFRKHHIWNKSVSVNLFVCIPEYNNRSLILSFCSRSGLPPRWLVCPMTRCRSNFPSHQLSVRSYNGDIWWGTEKCHPRLSLCIDLGIHSRIYVRNFEVGMVGTVPHNKWGILQY